MWELDYKEIWLPKNWCFWTAVLENTLKSPLHCKEIQLVHAKGDQSWVFLKDWCWSWNSNTLATWCEELNNWKRLWCWERFRGRRRRGLQRMRWLDGITDSMDMGCVDSRSWWWTGRPGVLWFMGSQRVGHDWVTELNWIHYIQSTSFFFFFFPAPWSIWYLCSPTKDRTQVHGSQSPGLNHWTARDFQVLNFIPGICTFGPLSENVKQRNLHSTTSLVNSKHLRTVTQDFKTIDEETYQNLWLLVFTCLDSLKDSSFLCPLLSYRYPKCCSFFSWFSFDLLEQMERWFPSALHEEPETWNSFFPFYIIFSLF